MVSKAIVVFPPNKIGVVISFLLKTTAGPVAVFPEDKQNPSAVI